MRDLAGAVLDTSAVMAHFYGEQGSLVVSEALALAPVMSAANWCEVLEVTGRRGDEATRYLSLVEILPLTLEHCRASVRYHVPGLSLGDRCCLALADVLGRPVVTADRAWERVAGSVEVRLIR